VDHAILQPEVGNAQPDHIVDNVRDEFGGAEDIDQVNACAAARSG
jgi:hypothetical protein